MNAAARLEAWHKQLVLVQRGFGCLQFVSRFHITPQGSLMACGLTFLEQAKAAVNISAYIMCWRYCLDLQMCYMRQLRNYELARLL